MVNNNIFATYFSALQPFFGTLPTEGLADEELRQVRAITLFWQVLLRDARQITFFGTFKAGKSTLVNSMLGTALLPAGANRTTGTATALTYGDTPASYVLRRDASGQFIRQPIAMDALSQYVQLDLSSGESVRREEIEEVIIQLPLPLLRHRCRFVDTPGMNDTSLLDESVYAILDRTDLAVLVLNATQILSEEEKQEALYVQRLLDGNIVFVITRLEQLNESDRQEVLDWVEYYLDEDEYGNDIIGQRRYFPVSSKTMLEQRINGTQTASVDGLNRFEQWLIGLLSRPDGDRMAARSRLAVLSRRVAEVQLAFQQYAAVARQRQNKLQHDIDNHHAKKCMHFEQQVKTAKYDLDLMHDQTTMLANGLIDGTISKVQRLMEGDSGWKNKIQTCLQATLNEYVGRVQVMSDLALYEKLGNYPLFNLHVTETMSASGGGHASKIGAALGTLGALFLIGSGPVGWLVGAGVGALVGKGMFGRDVKQETMKAVRQVVEGIVPTVKQETQSYIDSLTTLLEQHAQQNMPRKSTPPGLVTAREAAERYDAVYHWCEHFQHAILATQKQFT